MKANLPARATIEVQFKCCRKLASFRRNREHLSVSHPLGEVRLVRGNLHSSWERARQGWGAVRLAALVVIVTTLGRVLDREHARFVFVALVTDEAFLAGATARRWCWCWRRAGAGVVCLGGAKDLERPKPVVDCQVYRARCVKANLTVGATIK